MTRANALAHTVRRLLAAFLFALALPAFADNPPPIAIGFYLPVIRDFPRKDVEISLRFWVDELARSLDLTYKPVEFYNDMTVLKQDIEAGKINFLVGTSMGVAQHFDPAELGDGFSGYKLAPDQLLLVVRRDAGITTPRDLAGKRIGLLDGDELSDIYLESLMAKAWGKPDWNKFAHVGRELRSSKLTHRLFFGRSDAALIYRSGYDAAVSLNPQVGRQLQVLEDYTFKTRSPHIGLFSSQVRPEHREAISRAALRLNETARGRQVMQIYQADQMVVTRVRDLAPYYELLATHRAMRSGGARSTPMR